MKKTLAAGLLAALTFLLAGCGSGGDDVAAQSISDSIMKEQKKSGSTTSQFFTMKQKDADCIGKGLVDKIGTDQLQEYGLLTKDNKTKKTVDTIKMSKADAKSATNVLFDCTDVEGMMKKAMTSSQQIPEAMKACVTKVLTEDNLRVMFEGIFSGDQEGAQKALVAPMMKCAAGSQG